MKRKFALYPLAAAALITILLVLFFGDVNQSLAGLTCSGERGVVDKTPCEAFEVKITFKNIGTTEGTWLINVAFEGVSWSWTGASQKLTLKSYKTKTVTWNGTVPCEAPVDSVARLVVYYNDSFIPLDWWIHVVSDAELAITSSSVK